MLSRPIARRPFAALMLALALTGCSALPSGKPDDKTDEAPQKKPAAPRKTKPLAKAESPEPLPHAPVDDGAAAPVFMPDLADAPRLTLDQQLRIRFHEKARRAGAPKSVPVLRALVLADPRRLRAAFTAMGMNVWAISWDGRRIEESRSPRLPEEVKAERFLRDFAFALWPEESVRRSIPADADLVVLNRGGTEIRALIRNQASVLRAVRTTSQGRELITITNAPEGYTIDIETAR